MHRGQVLTSHVGARGKFKSLVGAPWKGLVPVDAPCKGFKPLQVHRGKVVVLSGLKMHRGKSVDVWSGTKTS